MKLYLSILTSAIMVISCTGGGNNKNTTMSESKNVTQITDQYGYNRDFLKKYTGVLELKKGNSAITVIPAWQGRVMTSTTSGDAGFSFGWINHDLIASGQIQKHINAFGGEERLWLGPEGGQFSLFFPAGETFVYDNWQVPDFLDTAHFEVIRADLSSALLARNVTTQNYSGTQFSFRLEREVTILDAGETEKQTSVDASGLDMVCYRSDNTIINTGGNEWKHESGLPSIWMLGMFIPSPAVVVVIPVKETDKNNPVPAVNDNYFGKIAADRLKVSGSTVFFRADGKSRGKIGIPPLRSSGIAGSYDADNKILTLLICKNANEGAYVNSAWEIQKDPYSGDAMNSYNDGPLEDGTQMGPFYELETSSPAAALKPGEKLTHSQFTLHLTGDPAVLDKVSRKVLGVSLDEIVKAF